MQVQKICFVSAGFYQDHMGGAELAIKQLAETFLTMGWQISFVAQGDTAGKRVTAEGYEVYYYQKQGRLTGLNIGSMRQALVQADAAVYYQRVTSLLTWVTMRHCRRQGRVMIWASAHNEDCQPYRHVKDFGRGGRWRGYHPLYRGLKLFNNLLTDWAYHRGIKGADHRIAQSVEQQQLLADTFGVTSTVLYRGYPGAGGDVVFPEKEVLARQRVVWVANLRPFKRPDVFVALAQALADKPYEFIMVGAPSGSAKVQAEFEAQVAQLPHLHYWGLQPHEAVLSLLTTADLFVLTSRAEGFPTVMIEAWLAAVPVISYGFDADDLVVRYGVGGVTTDFDALVALVNAFLTGEQTVSDSAFREVLTLFDLQAHCDALVALVAR